MAFPGVISKNPSKYFLPQTILAAGAKTTAGNGTAVDRAKSGGYAGLTLMTIPGAWTDGTHGFVIEESDTSSTTGFTTVAATDLIGSFSNITSSGSAAVFQRVDYIGRARWVRVNNTVSGVTSGAVFGVTALLFAPSNFPAS